MHIQHLITTPTSQQTVPEVQQIPLLYTSQYQYTTLPVPILPSHTFHVFIRIFVSYTILLYTAPSDSIIQLKQKINGSTGIPTLCQNLNYCGRRLQNIKTCRYYNINHESTIFLTSYLQGGSIIFTKNYSYKNIAFYPNYLLSNYPLQILILTLSHIQLFILYSPYPYFSIGPLDSLIYTLSISLSMSKLTTKNSVTVTWEPLLGYNLPLSTLCDHIPQPHMRHSNTDSEDTNSEQSSIRVHSLIKLSSSTMLLILHSTD